MNVSIHGMSKQMLTTVTGKNQVTIPAAMARKYHIENGARLDWRDGERENELRVYVHPGPAEVLSRIRALGARYAVRAPDAAKVLSRMREEEDSPEGGALGGKGGA